MRRMIGIRGVVTTGEVATISRTVVLIRMAYRRALVVVSRAGGVCCVER
jgi:hypothetical protein